jgi:hypothetical protein
VVAQYHSNMGNTGAFMVRRGRHKLITFGHFLPTYAPGAYPPQVRVEWCSVCVWNKGQVNC